MFDLQKYKSPKINKDEFTVTEISRVTGRK